MEENTAAIEIPVFSSYTVWTSVSLLFLNYVEKNGPLISFALKETFLAIVF